MAKTIKKRAATFRLSDEAWHNLVSIANRYHLTKTATLELILNVWFERLDVEYRLPLIEKPIMEKP